MILALAGDDLSPRRPVNLRIADMASLARQRPPSPAVVAAAAATDGGGRARQIVANRHRPAAALAVPSTSVLRPWRPLPVSVHRPPSPTVVAAAAATDGGGRARQIVAIHRRPCRPVNLVLRPWLLPLFQLAVETIAEESLQTKEKAEKVYFYLRHNF